MIGFVVIAHCQSSPTLNPPTVCHQL